MNSPSTDNVIWASCFVSHRTRKGMVSLRIKEHEVQLSTEEARELANNIARAAEASETDEMCMALMGDDVGIQMISLLRQYREVKIGIQKAEWSPAEIAERLRKAEPPPPPPGPVP